MTHYSDERAAEQAASSAQEQQPAVDTDEVTKTIQTPQTIVWQYFIGFFLIFMDWRLALVFWLVSSTNYLLSRLLLRLIMAVENGNSVRGR